MHPSLIASLLISIVLIGGAVFYRLSDKNSNPSYGLTVVSSSETDEEKGFLDNFIKKDDVSSTQATTTTLTTSDLIGRGLISDYVNLAVNQNSSTENIDNLVNQYIESIPSLLSSEQITYLDLKTEPNTRENFNEYAQKFANLEITLAQNIQTNSTHIGISKAYETAASSLKKMSVPLSLGSQHLQLTNSYLMSSAGMLALSEMEEDPATAFSGLTVVNANVEKELLLIKEIANILKLNGI